MNPILMDGPDELYLNGLDERRAFREASLGLLRAIEWIRADGIEPLDAATSPDELRRRLVIYVSCAALWYREVRRRVHLAFPESRGGLPRVTAEVLAIGTRIVSIDWAGHATRERVPDADEQMLDDALLARLRATLEPLDFMELDQQLRIELLGLAEPAPSGAADDLGPPPVWDAIMAEARSHPVAECARLILAAAADLPWHSAGDVLDVAKDMFGGRVPDRRSRTFEHGREVLERLGCYEHDGQSGRGRRWRVSQAARADAAAAASYLRRIAS